MRIAIVGTGAMGSIYAGLLSLAGHDVCAIDLRRDHLDAIKESGLRISGASGDLVARELSVGTEVADAGHRDLWVISTKSHAVERVAADIAPLLLHDDVVLVMQNGLGAGERVAHVVPEHHIVVGIAEGFGSVNPAPGFVRHAGMRLLRLAELGGGESERIDRLVSLWADAGLPTKAFADVDQMVWQKLICNVTVSAPTTVFDLTVGELTLASEPWAVALGCTTEAARVAEALGVHLAVGDPLAYVTEYCSTILDASPSMRLDHLARRRSEIDVINGAVVDLGRDLGVPTPYNRTLSAIVRQRESRFDETAEA